MLYLFFDCCEAFELALLPAPSPARDAKIRAGVCRADPYGNPLSERNEGVWHPLSRVQPGVSSSTPSLVGGAGDIQTIIRSPQHVWVASSFGIQAQQWLQSWGFRLDIRRNGRVREGSSQGERRHEVVRHGEPGWGQELGATCTRPQHCEGTPQNSQEHGNQIHLRKSRESTSSRRTVGFGVM